MRNYSVKIGLTLLFAFTVFSGCSDKGEQPTDSGETAPTLSIAGNTAIEGQPVTFTVSLSKASGSDVTFSYATQAGTAVQADFTANSGTGKVTAGKTSTTISVATVDDQTIESTESFSMVLSKASAKFTGSDSTAAGQILDNDAAPVVQISDVTVTEGDTAKFTVSVSKTVTNSIIFGFHTIGGTATSGTDFVSRAAVDSIAANQSQRIITIVTNDDSDQESDEQFTLMLDSASVTMVDSIGVATIKDNDGPVLTVDYNTEVKPIIDSKGCAGPSCHGGGAGGFQLNSTSYNDVVNAIANGHNVVVPFDASSSTLYLKTTASPPFGSRMPLVGDTLTTVQQNLVRDWINEGANATAP